MPNQFEISVQKTLRSGKRTFNLQVDIQTESKRLIIAGPSGAGKSILLQTIAGLLKPDQGQIKFRGLSLFDKAAGINMTPQARQMAYVFQEYALFPHLNVRQNIAFGLSNRWFNPSAQLDTPAVARWLRAFQLEPLAHQFPDQLSGGQRQRTALARALVGAPRALLLDEPFTALDKRLRDNLRDELRELLQELDLPLILITHDEADIRELDGDVVNLHEGRRL